MSPLLGSDLAAHAAALAVRCGYLLSLAGSFVLLLFPLRHVLADVLLGGHDALSARWAPATAGLVATAYLTACFLPSIWTALSLVGATATTMQAWIIPSLLVLVLERRPGRWGGGAVRGKDEQQEEEGGGSSRAAAVVGAEGSLAAAAAGGGGGGGGRSAASFDAAAAGIILRSSGSIAGSAAADGDSRHARYSRQTLATVILLIGVALFVNAFIDAIFGGMRV